ncbi:PhzF family phenazine biosynthesis protein [Acetobacterium woodii]|uniref:Phenazine biosynthesis protein, PhzF family n=1 Tax=Acetobacterium woodii (strain ATCC 29683 / DSM 1030 / JCM 2381 / KCTC 1655 / WB1) TaxID=931626 RepID=H6LKV4_ACEWD|nr:PhzF family phenazine biosynthesis protein [Acetobacterium woodii]AFA50063.1 phenazine biosynthesis protein, PhzF family [Acetobacterium woodii DSM 1030]
MDYYHVDVFSSQVLSGNGLTVIFHEEDLEAQYMQNIAQEFKQFETIFLRVIGEKHFRARIFTVEEELDFAGHPILGAVATIHKKRYSDENNIAVEFELNAKTLQAQSIKISDYFQATMNQGVPEFLGRVENEGKDNLLHALNLTSDNLYHELPMEVVTTGLSYLIVPLASGLEQAKISVDHFEMMLSKIDAKFVYVFDVDNREGRTWDNLGAVEDVATGSAAGAVAAYLYKWNICKTTEDIILNQGRFVGRPSQIKVWADQSTGEINVVGDVKIIAEGALFL